MRQHIIDALQSGSRSRSPHESSIGRLTNAERVVRSEAPVKLDYLICPRDNKRPSFRSPPIGIGTPPPKGIVYPLYSYHLIFTPIPLSLRGELEQFQTSKITDPLVSQVVVPTKWHRDFINISESKLPEISNPKNSKWNRIPSSRMMNKDDPTGQSKSIEEVTQPGLGRNSDSSSVRVSVATDEQVNNHLARLLSQTNDLAILVSSVF